MSARMRHGWRASSLPLLLAAGLVACQGAATPAPSPSSATETETEIAPVVQAASATATPIHTPSPAPTQSPWPTYETPTLAPFPISISKEQPTAVYFDAAIQEYQAPLAINPHEHFYFARPIADADLKSLIPSQRYGVYQEAGDNTLPHLGLDIGLNAGTPVHAAGDGTVLWASYGLLYKSENYLEDPYGIAVVIRHDFGYEGQTLYTVYAHLREAQVKVGDHVESGQVIAMSGSTGQSTGPHLHFEVRLGGNTVYFTHNPELWMAPPEGYGTLAGKVMSTNGSLLEDRLVEVRPTNDSYKLYTMFTYVTQYRLLPDDYFDENFVLSDLPAGSYEVAIPYYGLFYRVTVEIKPGEITYFNFSGSNGYSFDLPAAAPPANIPN